MAVSIDISSKIADAFVLCELGSIDAAVEILDRLLGEAELQSIPLNINALGSILALCVHVTNKEQSQFPELFGKLHRAASSSLGTQHPLCLSAHFQAANSLFAQDRVAEAADVASELLKECEQLV